MISFDPSFYSNAFDSGGFDPHSFELFANTVQELSLAQDIDTVIHIVQRVARKLTGADGVTFVLREGNQCYYVGENAISPLWQGRRFSMDTCISGWVMNNKKHVIIEDIYTDHRIPKDVYKLTFIKSMAMVPICAIKPIGAIGAYWARPHRPSNKEINLLQILANITSVSVKSIEARNKLEETVQERTKELVEYLEGEKYLNEMKSMFMSTASHEFRTPLSSILSSISLIENYKTRQEYDKQEKHIARIKASVKNLTHILDDFLSLEKLEQNKVSVELARFDLPALIQDVALELEGMRKEEQTIHYKHEGDNIVWLDSKILQNIMLNLLSNAIKYSSKDIEILTTVCSNQVKIEVKDQGIGIPESVQDKLFSKFFRAPNTDRIEGTGLGMNIVKRYIELLGGTIDFESQENIGTTFSVSLPNNQTELNITQH